MIDQPFRAWLANKAQPLIKTYQALGLTPNHVTLMGCVFGFASAGLVALGQNWAALGIWWAGRLLDGTDGIYARATGRASDFGGYLDIVCDMAAYSVMILGFAWSRSEFMSWWLVILLLYVLCITSALALGSLERREGLRSEDNRSLRLAAGLAEGGETGIAYSLLLLFPSMTGFLCAVWVGVLTLTVAARTLIARNELKK